jgi:uncharacterized protein
MGWLHSRVNWIWRRLATAVSRHPRGVVMFALIGLAGLAAGLPQLEFLTGEDTLVDRDSDVYQDSVRYQSTFGGEPMLVLFTADTRPLYRDHDALETVAALEEELRATGEFAAVIGPASSLDFAAGQLSVAPELITEAIARDADDAAEAAREAATAAGEPAPAQEEAAARAAAEAGDELQAALDADMARLDAAGEPSLDNPAFVEFLVFDAGGDVRPALRTAFLDEGHSMLVVVRLPGNASIEEQSHGAELVKEIVDRHPIPGSEVEVLATGSPVLLAEINDYLRGGMAILGAFAVGAMVLLLVVVFRARWPLLPLAVVVVGTVGAFGAVGWTGIPLTLVTISGLPILIGLGVDFAIQMHNRYEEERAAGLPPDDAAERTVRRMSPPLSVAMVAAVAGFLALQWARVPMFRDFGLLMSVGVAVLVTVAIVMVVPLLLLRDRRWVSGRARRGGRTVEAAVRAVSSAPPRTAVPLAALGALILAAGMVVEGRLPIQTDVERWVDQDGTAIGELEDLREDTGFSHEFTMLVEADDVTEPEAAAWVQRFGEEAVARHPALLVDQSMPAIATAIHGTTPGGDDLPILLSVAPDDIAHTLISGDRTRANIIFPIAPISLAEREQLLDDLAVDLDRDLAPPPGVSVTPSGLAVVGVELVNNAEAGRPDLTLRALGFVLIWMVLALRRVVPALLIVAPVAIAVGLSSLAIAVFGIELTPLTTLAGPLVIAIGTEFSVLVAYRYFEERARGRTPDQATAVGLPRIGRAFVASGLTLIGGFAVLAFSPMPLLRDFGIVVALVVLITLVSTLAVLPPLLRWADRRPRLLTRPAREVPEMPTGDDHRDIDVEPAPDPDALESPSRE